MIFVDNKLSAICLAQNLKKIRTFSLGSASAAKLDVLIKKKSVYGFIVFLRKLAQKTAAQTYFPDRKLLLP